MDINKLNKEDMELIREAMTSHSVTLIGRAISDKDFLSEKEYNKQMAKGKRLAHLINVLNDTQPYDFCWRDFFDGKTMVVVNSLEEADDFTSKIIERGFDNILFSEYSETSGFHPFPKDEYLGFVFCGENWTFLRQTDFGINNRRVFYWEYYKNK